METGFRELAEGECQEIGWPTVPVCPALRGLPGCRTSSAKTKKVPGLSGQIGHPNEGLTHEISLWFAKEPMGTT